ncbi:COBRA-like protein 11 [Dorcoceras hygrometricum]|uniref:COBRA-like protein 11 n=1 Tax=Dorcoceras hygrometricum TaxID=472368 RepID=A0A2Z7AUD2_9LAMI|nr:COBRA-like protein 11 [Dorcoceras hygrometricum]
MSLLSVQMLAGFTTEEAEADTVADQGLKRVNRIFGGLNEGIWPKTEELTKKLDSAKLTSAYLLEETEISNADVSIYVEEAGGSTRDIIITITRAVGTITEAVGTITRAVGRYQQFKRKGICG